MKLYVMELLYWDIDNFEKIEDIYISDDKYKLLKLFLNHKKLYDFVKYRIQEREGNPLFVTRNYN